MEVQRRATMVIFAMLLALIATEPQDDGCGPVLEFTDVRDGTVAYPFGFRLRNARCVGPRDAPLLARCAGCEQSSVARDIDEERSRLQLAAMVTVLVLVDENPFQLFTLSSAFVVPVREDIVKFDATFFNSLHFEENSSDPIGFVGAHQLAPGNYTLALKLIHPDSVQIGRRSNSGRLEINLLFEDMQLLGVDSEPCRLEIQPSAGVSWAEEGLLEATRTAALWTHCTTTACLQEVATRSAGTSARDEQLDDSGYSLQALPVFVFNQPERSDRRQHMARLTSALGLERTEYIAGIPSDKIDAHLHAWEAEGLVGSNVLEANGLFLSLNESDGTISSRSANRKARRYYVSNAVMHLEGVQL